MDQRGIDRKNATFYSHMLPSLETGGWRNNRVSGNGWMAIGDAAGMVDPITGEGIYYAIRSGDLASRVLLNDAHGILEKASAYRALLAREFTHDLEFAAMLAKRVFVGSFCFRSVPQRMVTFMQRSQRFRELMQDLFAGTQSYLDLRARLLRMLGEGVHRTAMQFFLDRVIPENSRVILYELSNHEDIPFEALFARAQAVIPGGVNSPVRAFRGVGGTPLFIESGTGSRLFDADGNSYIDYVGSWGPLLLGHRPPQVIDALRAVLETGTSFGAPTEREVELAELISQIVPSMEMVRLVNSGTEPLPGHPHTVTHTASPDHPDASGPRAAGGCVPWGSSRSCTRAAARSWPIRASRRPTDRRRQGLRSSGK